MENNYLKMNENFHKESDHMRYYGHYFKQVEYECKRKFIKETKDNKLC